MHLIYLIEIGIWEASIIMSDNMKILVCCHKNDEWVSDELYMPIHCGKAVSEVDLGIQGDNTGNNISAKNRSYCELTGLYWAWKNLENIDYIGLCHYRRYFLNRKMVLPQRRLLTFRSINDCLDLIVDKKYVKSVLSYSDIILPVRNVCPYNLRTEFSYILNSMDYKIMKEVIIDLYPNYVSSFEEVMYYGNRYSAYNMFIMKWNEYEDYMKWLFDILYEIEKRSHIEYYKDYYCRLFGYMSERLLNVYVVNKRLKVTYLPVAWITKDYSTNILKESARTVLYNMSFLLNKPRKEESII